MADLRLGLVGILSTAPVTDQISIVPADIRPPEPTFQQQRRSSPLRSPSHLESRTKSRTNAKRSGKRRYFAMFASKRSPESEQNDKNLIDINLDDHPKGYPRIAVYINSDNNSALFRRFGDLRARLLLYMQAEITGLEAQLAKLDTDDDEKEDTKWRNAYSISVNDGRNNEARKELLQKIAKRLDEYDVLLLRDKQLRSLPRPSQPAHRNLKDYIYLTNQIGRDDQRPFYHQHDFVSLQDYEESWLDDLMHRFMGHCKSGILRKLFVSATDRKKTDDPYIHYYSEARLGALIKVIVAISSTALLLVPVYLFLIYNLSTKLMASITLIFAFLFATAISVFTGAKRQEVFGATAAYCAVLVVFIGNLQQKQWSP